MHQKTKLYGGLQRDDDACLYSWNKSGEGSKYAESDLAVVVELSLLRCIRSAQQNTCDFTCPPKVY